MDVYTCKGLSADGHWLNVTDTFNPHEDPRVVVVAQLSPQAQDGRIIYELVDPNGYVAFSERRDYPTQSCVGIWWDCSRLVERGGEGFWTANVFSDGQNVGQAEFLIGDAQVEDETMRGRYMMVTADEDNLAPLELIPLDEEVVLEPATEPAVVRDSTPQADLQPAPPITPVNGP